MMLLLIVSTVSANDLEIVEVREQGFWERIFGGSFALSTDKNSYKIGEVAYIEAVQDINEYCDSAEIRFDVKSSVGTVKLVTRDVGVNIAPQNAIITLRFDTKGYKAGDYSVETRWYCYQNYRKQELGRDGFVDYRKERDVINFELRN